MIVSPSIDKENEILGAFCKNFDLSNYQYTERAQVDPEDLKRATEDNDERFLKIKRSIESFKLISEKSSDVA